MVGLVRIATKVIQGFIYLKLNYLSSGAPSPCPDVLFLDLARDKEKDIAICIVPLVKHFENEHTEIPSGLLPVEVEVRFTLLHPA